VALLYRGKSVAELEEGWASLHAIDRDRGGGVQQHVKLLNPAPRIREILEMVGSPPSSKSMLILTKRSTPSGKAFIVV